MRWFRDAASPLVMALGGDLQLPQPLAGDERLSVPPWVVAVLGGMIFVLGITYFVLRARRSSHVGSARAPKATGSAR